MIYGDGTVLKSIGPLVDKEALIGLGGFFSGWKIA